MFLCIFEMNTKQIVIIGVVLVAVVALLLYYIISRPVAQYKLVVQNTQSANTPSQFQQLLQLNLSNVISNPSQLLNLKFCADPKCNSPLYAWIESYTTTLSNVTVWVKLPSGIPAKSQTTIYLAVLNGSQYPYTGIAPQLTATYAQYDNGSIIFPYYQRFGGLSSLPSGWSEISGTIINFYTTHTQVAPSQFNSGWYGIYLKTTIFDSPIAWDFYGNMYDAVNAGNAVGTAEGPPGNFNGYLFVEGSTITNEIYLGIGGCPFVLCINNGNEGNEFAFSTNYLDTNVNKVYSMYIDRTYVNMLLNYQSIFSTASAASQAMPYFYIAPSNNGELTPSTPIKVYWIRMRAFPPNGVMPSLVSFLHI